MRKLLICLAIATVAVSCKKIQAGGNKNALKLEEGAERYSDDHQVSNLKGNGHEVAPAHGETASTENKHVEAPKKDSTKTVETPKAEH